MNQASTRIDWTRYWFDLSAPIPMADGYLVSDPDAASLEARGYTLDQIRSTPCAVLLGAPGMGKTKEAEAAEAALDADGALANLIDVGRRADPGKLLIDLLSGPSCQQWVQGEDWHLFIDGIDEAAGAAPDFLENFRRFLEGLVASGGDLTRLRLRLLCRTVDWPDTLNDLIGKIWSEQDIQKLQIAPLRETDVRLALVRVVSDSTAAASVLSEVRARHLQALAGRPVSLRMLLQLLADSDGRLPLGQAELYELGLSSLLAEHDKDRRTPVGFATLTVDQQLMVAARIAAATVFSACSQITSAGSDDGLVEGVVSVSDISTDTEPSDGSSFLVEQADVIQVLGSSLFAPLGAGRFAWAHQTFPEYLTAFYAAKRQVSAQNMLDLLSVGLPSGSVAIGPQLREVAAWFATLQPSAFSLLLEREPDVLLQSDVAQASPDDRALLVEALLGHLEDEAFIQPFMASSGNLGKLAHPSLVSQLREVISDRTRPLAVRRAAVDIAEANNLSEIGPALVSIAFDTRERALLRKDAAFAVYRIADEQTQALLVPLLSSDLSADIDDELRGAVLLSAWRRLPVAVLLDAIDPPRDQHFIGAYSLALHQIRFTSFSEEDALAAIRWLDRRFKRVGDDGPDRSIRELAPQAFWRAADRIDVATVRTSLAALLRDHYLALTQWVLDDSSIQPARWPGSAEERLDFARQLVADQSDPAALTRATLWLSAPLFAKSDLRAITEHIPSEVSARVRTALSDIASELVNGPDFDDHAFVWDAAEKSPELRASLSDRFFIPFGSNAERWMRNADAQRLRFAARKQATGSDGQKTADAAALSLLGEIEGGETNRWWHLNLQLFVTDNGLYDAGYEHQGDLRDAPGWQRSDEAVRSRLIDAALTSLHQDSLQSERWIGSNSSYRPAAGAYRALFLVAQERPDAFAALSDQVLARWASSALTFFDNNFGANEKTQTEILSAIWAKAPASVLRVLARLFLRPKGGSLLSRTIELLDTIYDEHLGAFLVRLLSRPRLKEGTTRKELLTLLLRQSSQHAKDLFNHALDRAIGRATSDYPEPSELNEQDFAAGIAQLMAMTPREIWPRLHFARQANPVFARAVWAIVAADHDLRGKAEFLSLDEADLADVYLDLKALFPEPVEQFGGPRVLDTPDFVDRIRRNAANRIIGSGTAAGLAAFQRIIEEDPASGLEWRREEVRRNYRAKARRAYTATQALVQIKQMSANSPPLRDEVLAALATSPPPSSRSVGAVVVPSDPSGPVAAPDPTPSDARANRRRLLAVATEWNSAHGGVSTLNRELCVAMADLGHEVTCVVLDASQAEENDAGAAGVRLVKCPSRLQLEGSQRFLLLEVSHLGGYSPDFVIGHDHITGPYAAKIASDLDVPYVHLVHTVPGEAEFVKTRANVDLLLGSVKQERQTALAHASQMVVGIGPHIHDTVVTDLGDDSKCHMMMPGLNATLLATAQSILLPQMRCLLTGRMEDAKLKGADIGCQAIREVALAMNDGIERKLMLRGFDRDDARKEFAEIGTLDEFQSHILLKGYSSTEAQIHRDIGSASLILMPSRVEGFGLTGYEAIAAGVPAIVSLQSGLGRYLIFAGQRGLIPIADAQACVAPTNLSPNDTVQEWANKITAVFADRNAARARAESLRRTLERELSWRIAAQTLSRRLEAVLF